MFPANNKCLTKELERAFGGDGNFEKIMTAKIVVFSLISNSKPQENNKAQYLKYCLEKPVTSIS
jgi:hypothetical protein